MHMCEYCNKNFELYRSFAAHRCQQRTNDLISRYDQHKIQILEEYNNGVPLIEIAQSYNFTNVWLRSHMSKTGVNMRIKHSRNGEKILAKAKSTWLAKYGVDNPSKLSSVKNKVKETINARYGVYNATNSMQSKIKHYITGAGPDPARINSYQEYRKIVEKLTSINRKQVPNRDKCYYSNINICKNKHFNDALYPTIDHRIGVWYGFENNIPPEKIGSIDNLVWCARILNKYKGTMTEEQFRASGILERFLKYVDQIH